MRSHTGLDNGSSFRRSPLSIGPRSAPGPWPIESINRYFAIGSMRRRANG
jgi:hypothetical protein